MKIKNITMFLIVLDCASTCINAQSEESKGFVNLPITKVITPSNFKEEVLVALAKTYISTGNTIHIEWLITNRKYYSCTRGPAATEMTYRDFTETRDKCMGHFDIARIIQIGSSASVEMRFQDGRRVKTIVGNKNPLILEKTGFGIIHLSVVTVNNLSRININDKLYARVSLVPVDGKTIAKETQWSALYQELIVRLGTYSMSIDVRKDYIFSEAAATYPFADIEITPTEAEYYKRDSIGCLPIKSVLKCYSTIIGAPSELTFPIPFIPGKLRTTLPQTPR